MGVLSSDWDDTKSSMSGGARDGRPATLRRPHRSDIWHSTVSSANPCLALGGGECNDGAPETVEGAGSEEPAPSSGAVAEPGRPQ